MSGQRDDLARVLGEHGIVATGLGEWCCKCTPMEWRPSAWRAAHLADVVLAAGFGLVRAVEEERDQLLRERDNIGCSRFTCASNLDNMTARAESAEAAYRAMFRQFEAMRADRDEALAALEAGDACGAVGCRALAERDRLRAGVEGLADEWSDWRTWEGAAGARLRALLASTSDRGDAKHTDDDQETT